MITIFQADFTNPEHTGTIQRFMSALALSEEGRGEAMSDDEQALLIAGLKNFPNKEVFLIKKGATYCGVAICFYQFSTFTGRELLKIHDVFVLPEYRGQHLGRKLVEMCIERAKARGCAFMTTEVALDNPLALQMYDDMNFVEWMEPTLFLELKL